MKQGFTLVELLAVIIILGVLTALIAPKVVNTLNEAEKNTNMTSAEALVKAAAYKYSNNEITGNINQYVIIDYTNNSNINYLDYTGTNPEEGILNITEEGNIAMSVKIGNYCYLKRYESQEITVINYDYETCGSNSDIFSQKFAVAQEVNGVKYYETTDIKNKPIYFNPTTGQICNYYSYISNTNNLGKSGCMKWYAYSENSDGTINMILDHNTTSVIEWVNQEHYEATSNDVGITYPQGRQNYSYGSSGDNSSGPITALKQLKADTNAWNIQLNINDYSYTVNMTSLNGSTSQKVNYKINYSGYKARLISAEEIANITGANKLTSQGGIEFNIASSSKSLFYFDGGINNNWDDQTSYTMGESNFSWLFNNMDICTDYGCDFAYADISGYWSASPVNSKSSTAWKITKLGRISNAGKVNSNTDVGIRPVITVSKNIVFINS